MKKKSAAVIVSVIHPWPMAIVIWQVSSVPRMPAQHNASVYVCMYERRESMVTELIDDGDTQQESVLSMEPGDDGDMRRESEFVAVAEPVWGAAVQPESDSVAESLMEGDARQESQLFDQTATRPHYGLRSNRKKVSTRFTCKLLNIVKFVG